MIEAGKVQALTGIVTARTPDGQVRELQIGDIVYENETLETATGANISIIQDDGNLVSLGGNDLLLLDDSVISDIDPRDAIAQDVAELQEAIVKTLAEGGDIDDIGEETAAGGVTDTHDFQAGFHSGDDSKGDVGTYLLDNENERTNNEYTQYIADEPDSEVIEPAVPAPVPPAAAPPTSPATPSTPPPTISITDEDAGTTPGDNSIVEGSGSTTSGNISVSGGTAIATVTIAGQDITGASTTPVVITGNGGTLTVTGYDPNSGAITYDYTEDGNAEDHSAGDNSVNDQFAVVVTDTAGATATDTLDIQIIDTAPVANPDVNSVTEDSTAPVVGNVITTGTGADTLGADTTTVTAVTGGAIGTPSTGTYGSITLNADGSYSYSLDNSNATVQALNVGQTLEDTFTYTITDADGDSSSTTLTITVNGATEGVPTAQVNDADGDLTPADNSVVEDTAGTVTGDITVTAPDGFDSVTIAGQNITNASTTPVVIAGTEGTLTVTGFDPSTGNITYSYTEDGETEDHSAGDDSVNDQFAVVVTDLTGATATDTLDIQIIDTAPVANLDVNSVTEDSTAPVVGNVITTGTGADTLGADTTTVTAVTGGTIGTPSTGTYGSITLNADGSYSYSLDNSNTDVQALNVGQTLEDTFTYTITDADGDSSSTTLTITVNGATEGVPTAQVKDVDGDLTPADNSVVEDTAGTVTGDITVTAPDGFDSVTIAGQNITNASTTPVVIAGTEGTLTVTGFDPSTGNITYSYTEDGEAEDHSAGDDSVNDQFAVVVTDTAGVTATDTLDIQIIDTAPVANLDVNSVTEDSTAPVVGNVITTGTGADTLGADATTVTAVTGGAIGTPSTGTYGSITLNADGSYSYSLDNSNATVQALNVGQTLEDTFTYTITDADGDSSSTTLTITVNGATEGVPTAQVNDVDGDLTAADNSVVEDTAGTVTGDITVTAPDGFDSVTIAGQNITNASTTPVVIAGTEGTLTVTGFDPSTGNITYSYTEDGETEDHSAGDDSVNDQFAVVVTDLTGATATDTLDIQIIDTAPVANLDVNSVTEDSTAPVVGNVITTGTGADTLGADTTTVTAVTGGTIGTPSTGTYGSITLNADGSYSYSLDNSNTDVQALNVGQTLEDTFTYTITDADGDSSSTTLTITVNGATEGVPTAQVKDVDGDLTPADNSVVEDTAGTVTGDITVTAPDGFDSVTIAGQNITNASTTPVVIAGTEGTLTVTGFDPSTGNITYSYTEDGETEDHSAGDDSVNDQFAVVVTDLTGATATDTLDIQIIDTAPVANLDVNSVTEDSTAPVVGNVITTGSGADTLGADDTTVTAVDGGTIGTPSTGTYGSITLNADGSYSYSLDNSNTDVQALNAGETLEETFTYTITDADGDSSSTTLTITVNGENEIVSAVADTGTVNEAGLSPDGNDAGDGSQVTTGNLLTNDLNTDASTIFTQIASNGNTDTTSTNGVLSLTTEHGTILVYTETSQGHSIGDYEYTLTDVTDGDNITDTISYTVDDGSGNSSTTQLTINIVDDEPVVSAQTASIELGSLSTNIIIIADRSGSMSAEINLEEDAIEGLVNAYLQYGEVNVNLTTFATGTSNSGWQNDVDSNYSVDMTASGWTDYKEAMEVAMNSVTTDKPDATQTIVYFLSDGKIAGQTHVQDFWKDADSDGKSDLLQRWETFIETETDQLFTFDMGGEAGDDLDAVALQADDFSGSKASLIPDAISKSGDVIVVEHMDDLESALVLTVGLHGQIIDGDTVTGSLVAFGADGGTITEIHIGNETYSYDGSQVVDSANNVISDSGHLDGITTDQDGVTFTIDLDSGAYTYSIDETVSRTEFHQEDLGVTFTDGDGDSASTTLTIEINPSLAPAPITNATPITTADAVLDFSAIPDATAPDTSADDSVTMDQVMNTSDPLLPPVSIDLTTDAAGNQPIGVKSTDPLADQTNTDPDTNTGLFSTTGADTATPTPADDGNIITAPVIVDTDI